MKKFDKDKIKKLINVTGRVITVLSLLFVLRAVYRLGFDLGAIEDIPAFIAVGIISSIVFAAGVFIQGFAWKSWLDFFIAGRTLSGADADMRRDDGRALVFVKRTDTREALCVYAKANIGKYLPGNVMHYVERNLFAARSGAPQSAVALSSVFEIGTQVAVAFLVAVVSGGGTIFELLGAMLGEKWKSYAIPAAVIGIIVLAVIVLAVWRFAGAGIKKLLSGYDIRSLFLTLIKTMLFYMSVMLLGGAIMALLYILMGGHLTTAGLLSIISGYVMAWVLGFIVPGAPGGLGVREFVLTMTIGGTVGGDLVVTLMILHRLISIIGDFLAYLVQGSLRKHESISDNNLP